MKKLEYATLNGDFKVIDTMTAAVADKLLEKQKQGLSEEDDFEDVTLAESAELEVGLVVIVHPKKGERVFGATLEILDGRYIEIVVNIDGAVSEIGIDLAKFIANGIPNSGLALPTRLSGSRKFKKFVFEYDSKTKMYSLNKFEAIGFRDSLTDLPVIPLSYESLNLNDYFKVSLDDIEKNMTAGPAEVRDDDTSNITGREVIEKRVITELAEITVIRSTSPMNAVAKVYTELTVVNNEQLKLYVPALKNREPVYFGLDLERILLNHPVRQYMSEVIGFGLSDMISNFVFYYDETTRRYSLLGVENREKTEEEENIAFPLDYSKLPGGN